MRSLLNADERLQFKTILANVDPIVTCAGGFENRGGGKLSEEQELAASCGGCCRGNSSRVHVAVSTESLWMLVWQTLITTGGGELVVDVAVKVVRAKKKKKNPCGRCTR